MLDRQKTEHSPPFRIHPLRILLLLMLLLLSAAAPGRLPGQESGAGQDALMYIHCDRDSLLLYLNGDILGRSPLQEGFHLEEGYHFVSFFNHEMTRPDPGIKNSRQSRILMELGTKSVYLHAGDTLHLSMQWTPLELQIRQWRSEERRGRLFTVSAALLLFLIGGLFNLGA